MPIYEYECESRSSRFELRRSFGEARHIFSPVPVFFKGPGFYVNDGGGRKGRPSSEDKGQGDDDKPA